MRTTTHAALRYDARTAVTSVARPSFMPANFAAEARVVSLTREKFCPRRCAVCESLRTDSLDFDRFRSANSVARDVFCKFFLHAVHRQSARKNSASKAPFHLRNRRSARDLLKNAAHEKALFHRVICNIGIFALRYRANRMSSASGFVFCGLRDRFSQAVWAAYSQRRCRVTFFFVAL